MLGPRYRQFHEAPERGSFFGARLSHTSTTDWVYVDSCDLVTPLPRGAVRYRCPCGAEYVVVIGAAAGDGWVETLEPVAASLGAEIVDGSLPRFACKACGAEHVRGEGNSAPRRRCRVRA